MEADAGVEPYLTLLASRTGMISPMMAPAFKDNMKEYAKHFYSSKAWKTIRENVKKRDRYLCVDCFKAGRYVPAEEVHHIVEITPENINDPSITLNEKNLVSLCKECHKKRHGSRQRRYITDEYGRVIIL